MSGPELNPPSTAPAIPSGTPRLPTLALWILPLVLVLAYVFVVDMFFHDQARWTGDGALRAAVVLVLFTALFSLIWYSAAYGASLVFGEWVALGILRLIARLPGWGRHVIVTPPTRPDTANEVWGRFGILFLVALGFELVFLLLIAQQGNLSPDFAIDRPFRFFPDLALAGLGLALLLAPAAPFLASRLRTRITDSLEFPLLWLAALLLVLGGSSILLVEVLPRFLFDPALFLTSILYYAPAAWYVCLAFSASETRAQQLFLHRAWASRGGRFHFGHLQVTDEPERTVTRV